ncbi:hypothetical protein PAPHI01_1038 [Pancytospora philotis]|nr:hypothetical protein PAPHI01_1038 [Pancytospora philotis]
MLLLGIFTCMVWGACEVLRAADLASPDTFLVFLYYEQPGFNCPTCKHFMKSLDQLPMPVKTLNFAENVSLGTRFFQFSFPAFVVRSGLRSRVISPLHSAELQQIIADGTWAAAEPVRAMCDVNSLLTRALSAVTPLIFAALRVMYYVVDHTPSYLVSSCVLCIICYLAYSIFEIFTESDEKLKVD